MIINRSSNERACTSRSSPECWSANRSSSVRDKRGRTRFVSQNKHRSEGNKTRSARWKFQHNDVCTIPPRENAKRFRENSIEPLRYSVTAIVLACLPNREERYSLERRSIVRSRSFRFFNFSTLSRDTTEKRKKSFKETCYTSSAELNMNQFDGITSLSSV